MQQRSRPPSLGHDLGKSFAYGPARMCSPADQTTLRRRAPEVKLGRLSRPQADDDFWRVPQPVTVLR